jgi:hypothetical protein
MNGCNVVTSTTLAQEHWCHCDMPTMLTMARPCHGITLFWPSQAGRGRTSTLSRFASPRDASCARWNQKRNIRSRWSCSAHRTAMRSCHHYARGVSANSSHLAWWDLAVDVCCDPAHLIMKLVERKAHVLQLVFINLSLVLIATYCMPTSSNIVY